jgi:hypothetical protein
MAITFQDDSEMTPPELPASETFLKDSFPASDKDALALARILEQIAAGFDPYGPSGTNTQEYKTLEAYLRQVYGDLPEGAVDWASGDLDGDGVNEVYAVDADGNPHTVYGYDDDGNVTSTAYVDYGGATGELIDTTTQNQDGTYDEGFGVEVDITPPTFTLPPPAESKQTDGGASGGGNVFDPTGGGIFTGGGTLPPSESKPTDGGGDDGDDGDDTDGPLDVLGEDWEYDPEHDYIYVGDCTFVRVDENGNPIGDPVVLDEGDCLEDTYTVGGNYAGPDSTWDPNIDINVDVFGEGSIIDTTKDNPPTENKQTSEPEEKEKDKTEAEEKEKDVVTPPTTPTTTPTQPPTQPPTESKPTNNGGNNGTGTNGGGNGTATESKQTDGGDDGNDDDGNGGNGPDTEGVITFENISTYYSNKDGGGGGGGVDDDDDGDDDDGDDDGIGAPVGMLTKPSSFTPQQSVPTYSTPTYAPINVPQQDYMVEINNLIARNSGMGMFKGYV